MRTFTIIAPVLTLLLVACSPSGPGAKTDFVYSYQDRYPLTAKPVSRIDVAAHRPAPGDAERIQAAAWQFRRSGQGKIVIFVPQTGQAALSSGNWVKQELIAQGIPSSRIQWDARAMPAGLVRVAYAQTADQTAWNCTNLNEDLQQRANETSGLNREPVNFGCAFQSNMKTQVEHAADFIQPRQETGVDPVRAANAVRQLRTKTNSPPSGEPAP